MRLSPHISFALVTLQGTWHWYHKIGEKPWHVSGEDLHTNHAAKVQVAIFSHQLLLDPAPTRAYDHQLLSKSLQKGQVCYRHSEYATFFCLVSLLDRSLLSSFLALLATSLSLSTGFPIAAEGTCNTKSNFKWLRNSRNIGCNAIEAIVALRLPKPRQTTSNCPILKAESAQENRNYPISKHVASVSEATCLIHRRVLDCLRRYLQHK